MSLDETLVNGQPGHLSDHEALKAEHAGRGVTITEISTVSYAEYVRTHKLAHNGLHANHTVLGSPGGSLPQNPTTEHLAHHGTLAAAYNDRTSSGDATVTPAAIHTTSSMPAPSVTAGGNATVTPAAIHTVASMPTPTVSRDPLQQPFASDSIWNMPLGSDAEYVSANFTPLATVYTGSQYFLAPQIDEEIIILEPAAPMRNVETNNVGWGGGDRCVDQGATLTTVPIPDGYTVPSNGENGCAAVLRPDGRTIWQNQPFTRCSPTGHATALGTTSFPDVDLYGLGISGSHGGSKLSAVGGSIRLGELRPGQQGPRHALKIILDSGVYLYNGSTQAECFRWPATVADSGAASLYGAVNNNQNVPNKMGMLLAIHPSVNIDAIGLLSDPGRQIAWTLQNYGGYVVDMQGGRDGMGLCAEKGPDGSKADEFFADYGWDLQKHLSGNTIANNTQPPTFGYVTPWALDMVTIWSLLHVINNNSATSVGGGGTPRQPLAAAISPSGSATVTPAAIQTVAAMPAPTVVANRNATVTPATIATAASMPAPSVSTGGAALTATLKAFGIVDEATSATGHPGSEVLGAITFAANSAVLVILGGIRGQAAAALTDLRASASGLTFSPETGAIQSGVQDTAWMRVLTAPHTSGGSTVITIDSNGITVYNLVYAIYELTGHNTADPVGAVAQQAQSAIQDNAYSITLDSAPASGSIVIAAITADTNAGASSVDPGTGWTEDADVDSTASFFGFLHVQRRTGSTSTTVTWNDIKAGASPTVFSTAAVAVEIKA